MKRLFLSVGLLLACAGTSFSQTSMLVANDETVDEAAPLVYGVKDGEIRTEGNGVRFAPNSAEILPSSRRTLATIKKYLDDKPYVSMLRIECHTDNTKGAQELSEARAIAICKWLVSDGVDCKRLLPVGFGSTKPITDMMNARTTFVNAALKGHAIGGMPLDGGGKVAGDACQ